jgi:hypothetical protein
MIKKEIYPKIMVFHNAIENTEDFLDEILNKKRYVEPWHEWYTLGSQTLFLEYPHFYFKSFPSQIEWDNQLNKITNPLAKYIANVFFSCTKQYVEENQIVLDNWVHGAPTICSHSPKEDTDSLAMQYHTDFIMSQSENPGYKHSLTCTIYINENYDGGEISYKIFKDNENYELFTYKPKSGDAIVFPSTEPYFHGVKKALKSDKYFIRMFWGYDFIGSESWLINEKKHGKDQWMKMEKERIDKENKSSMWMKGHLKED